MPTRVRSAIYNTHKYGLRVVGSILIVSFILAISPEDFGFPVGNLRLVFWFGSLYLNFLFLEKIDRKVSASIFLLSCYLSFYIYPFLPIESNFSENLFLLPTTLLVFSILPYLLFEIMKELPWVLSWVALFFITFFFAINHSIVMMDQERNQALVIVFTDYAMLAAAYVASWIFIQVMFYKYLKNIELQAERINEVNINLGETVDKLQHQSMELDEQAEELTTLQEELSALNNQLEKKVKERTASLEKQTLAMNKYGFMNSKLVRGPIEQLIKNEKFQKHDPDLVFLKGIIDDLDSITIAIGDVLNMRNTDGIRQVERSIKQKYGSNE